MAAQIEIAHFCRRVSLVCSYSLLLSRARLFVRPRHYITRPDLLNGLVEGTPWERLKEKGSDMAFISFLSVDRASFEYLHAVFVEEERERMRRGVRRGERGHGCGGRRGGCG